MRIRLSHIFFILFAAIFIDAATARPAQPATTINIVKEVAIDWDPNLPADSQRQGHRVYRDGQLVVAKVDLPKLPANQRDARRIVARLVVEPVLAEEDGKMRAADPWPRVGSVMVEVKPGVLADRGRAKPQAAGAAAAGEDEPQLMEVMRFVTGFGGPAEFTQDLTALAPLLSGSTRIAVFISTYKSPAWKATLTLSYSAEDVGYRRPIWAAPIFFEEQVTSDHSVLKTTVQVPKGIARPRLHVLSTGHATDGQGGDEFITRTHILRVDGREVARWRPWAESGGSLRGVNPMSGRRNIDGRELWSSDQDRSGWHPGEIVEPHRIPLPELTPGKHQIELEIVGIRPKHPPDDTGHYGYWRVSSIAVADEPWPN